MKRGIKVIACFVPERLKSFLLKAFLLRDDGLFKSWGTLMHPVSFGKNGAINKTLFTILQRNVLRDGRLLELLVLWNYIHSAEYWFWYVLNLLISTSFLATCLLWGTVSIWFACKHICGILTCYRRTVRPKCCLDLTWWVTYPTLFLHVFTINCSVTVSWWNLRSQSLTVLGNPRLHLVTEMSFFFLFAF